MFAFYENFEKENIKIAYFGRFTNNISTMLIELLESYELSENQQGKFSNAVSTFIIDSFRNVDIQYNPWDFESEDFINQKDYLQLNILKDRIMVSSANVIEKKYVQLFDDEINYLNLMDSVESKLQYHGALSKTRISAGASLAMVEMLRKSNHTLQKMFVPINEKYSRMFLSLEVFNNRNSIVREGGIFEIERNYKLLTERNTLIFYKGDFSTESNANLVELVHDNLIDGNSMSSGNIKNMITVIEIIQNVTKHGKSVDGHKPGIFTLFETNKERFLECSNYIDLEHYETFKNYIEKLKSSSNEEIQKYYKKKLYNTEISELGNSGIGLLEIAMFTRNNFSFTFTETSEKEIFYTLIIKTA
jgi:hypothetical protein